jgi:ADP-ribosylglycohydrolase
MRTVSPAQRTRLYTSLDGLSVGDAFGDRIFFEFRTFQAEVFELPLALRPLPAGRWSYTDDTQMALSIVDVLTHYGSIDQDALARSFGERFERGRGYGAAMYELLPQLRVGHPWQAAATALFGGQGSYGNGAAMRVAPLGACFADDLGRVVEGAARSAEVTHTHPEAIAGAIAVAVAAATAWQFRQAGHLPDGAAFLDQVIDAVPASTVRDKLLAARAIPAESPIWEVVRQLGNGSGVTAQDTVPYVLWCAAHWLDSYPEAIWRTASGLGDIDTNCAMVGGIVTSYTGQEGIPVEWLRRRESLPAWAFDTTAEFTE